MKKTTNNLTHLYVRVKPAQKVKVKAKAKKEGKSEGQVVREALDKHL